LYNEPMILQTDVEYFIEKRNESCFIYLTKSKHLKCEIFQKYLLIFYL
jgi:hypothetical protein